MSAMTHIHGLAAKTLILLEILNTSLKTVWTPKPYDSVQLFKLLSRLRRCHSATRPVS